MSANGLPPDGSADKTLGEIVTEVSEKASLLVREEIELAKAEVTDKVTKLGKGAVVAVAAGVFAGLRHHDVLPRRSPGSSTTSSTGRTTSGRASPS